MNQNISDSISKELCHSGLRINKIAIPLFYDLDKGKNDDFQTPISMFSIALELLLKSLIAKKSAHLIFEKLPSEITTSFEMEALISKVNRRKLENFKFDTINFEKSVSLVSQHYNIDNFKSHLKKVRLIRNQSLHSVISSLDKSALYHLFYLVVILSEKCYSVGCTEYNIISETERIFIKKINIDQIGQLRERVDCAQKKAEELIETTVIATGNKTNWNSYKGECSICSSYGNFTGETQLVGNKVYQLIFKPSSFECPNCGFELFNCEELDKLHFEKIIPRDEDLAEYMISFGTNYKAENK